MRLAPAILLVLAAPAAAQTGASTGSGASARTPSMGTAAGTNSGSAPSNTTQIGRPPAALGASSTLSNQIDSAAGLDSTRSQGGISMPSTMRSGSGAGVGSGSTGGVASSVTTAGQPAGRPLGTSGVATDPTTGVTRPIDPSGNPR